MTPQFVEYKKLKNKVMEFNDGRTKLDFANRNVQDLSEIIGLSQLQDLDELDLSKNKISQIKCLENLTNLKKLDLSKNQIEEIKGLENLANLKSLNLSFNAITDSRTLDILKENHRNLEDLDLIGNPCFNPIKAVKAEILKQYPSKERILAAFSHIVAQKDTQVPIHAPVSESVGVILKSKPEFFIQEIYNNLRKIIGTNCGNEEANQIEKSIIEKNCLYDGEQIVFESEGHVRQIEKFGVQASIIGRFYVTNNRILAQGNLSVVCDSDSFLSLAKKAKSEKKLRASLINRSLHQELPCYGYQFPFKDHLGLKIGGNVIVYEAILDDFEAKSSKIDQEREIRKNARRFALILTHQNQKFKKNKKEIKEEIFKKTGALFEILRQDANYVLRMIKEELEKEFPSAFKLEVRLNELFESEEYEQLTDSEYFDIVRETYKLNPEIFMTLIYPRMKSWKSASFKKLKKELFKILREEGAKI